MDDNSRNIIMDLLNRRFDDVLRQIDQKIDSMNRVHEERYIHVKDILAAQNRDIEDKHIQNKADHKALVDRVVTLEKKADFLTAIYRFGLFLFGAVGTIISYAFGLLEPLARAWRAMKGGV